MLSFLPGPILGILTYTLLMLSISLSFVMLMSLLLCKLIVPLHRWRRWWTRVLEKMVWLWTLQNYGIFRLTQPIVWDVQIPDDLSPQKHYLLLANHQTWADIPVVLHAVNFKTSVVRIFTKRDLLWVPIVGWACWALEFPLMYRFSKDYLAKHPEQAGKDFEITRQMCEKYTDLPVTVLSYAEGSRITTKKHAAQQSPYRYLLKPKAGGVAVVLNAMGDYFDSALDMTVVYHSNDGDEHPDIWKIVSGQVNRITIRVEKRDIPAALRGGDYTHDNNYRNRIQTWLGELWTAKDRLIHDLHNQHTT